MELSIFRFFFFTMVYIYLIAKMSPNILMALIRELHCHKSYIHVKIITFSSSEGGTVTNLVHV